MLQWVEWVSRKFGSMPIYFTVGGLVALVATYLGPDREQSAAASVSDLRRVAAEIAESGQESKTAVVIRELGRHTTMSAHFVRLEDEMATHVHRTHDETVVTLSGAGILILEGKEHPVGPGSLLLIPRGTAHGARSTGSVPMEVVSFFSPPFDGKDRHVVD